MFKNKKTTLFTLLALTIVVIVGVKTINSNSEENVTSEKNTPALEQVDSKNVCMVTDKLFNKEQIPVEVEGKTYYGCCEMCKGRLANDPDVRLGTDPLSEKKVDKAQSITAANPEGDIYYFENEHNFQKFVEQN